MNQKELGAKLVEQLLAWGPHCGLTEHDLTLIAENNFAAERAAIALSEVAMTLCLLFRQGSRRYRKLTVRTVCDEIERAGSHDAHARYALARDACGLIRRRNGLNLVG